jgi:hypothetical protein
MGPVAAKKKAGALCTLRFSFNMCISTARISQTNYLSTKPQHTTTNTQNQNNPPPQKFDTPWRPPKTPDYE